LTAPRWKEFEDAVTKFVAALDPKAKVTANVKLPDAHTSKPRQRDVWIETNVCNHFPLKVLISCKRLRRRIDQQDIDAFNGELISSEARLGVLYAYSGFTSNAIEKAKKLGVSCCRLFDNEPADIPDSLIFVESYCCTPRISVSVMAPLDQHWNLATWNELFSLQFEDEDSTMSVIDAIVRSYRVGEKEAASEASKTFFPPNWARILECVKEDSMKKTIRIIIRGSWNVYEGRLEAHLLKGSYNFSSGQFLGSFSTPSVDTQSSHPGPGWTLIEGPPGKSTMKPIKSLFIMSGGNAKESLVEQLGPRPITIEQIDPSLINPV
jgi:hypothetical protein